MYVVVSIVDQELGIVKLCTTFGEALAIAVAVAEQWAISTTLNSDFVRSLENVYEYLYTDPNDDSQYAVYIGKVEE